MTKIVIFHAPKTLWELLTLAAQQEEVSRSDFLRTALRERATRVLAEIAESPTKASRGVGGILVDQSGEVLGLRGAPKKDSK